MTEFRFEETSSPFLRGYDASNSISCWAYALRDNEQLVINPGVLSAQLVDHTNDQRVVVADHRVERFELVDSESLPPRTAINYAMDLCQNVMLMHDLGYSPSLLNIEYLILDQGCLGLWPVGRAPISQTAIARDTSQLIDTVLRLFGGSIGHAPPLTNDNVLNGLLETLSTSTEEQPAIELNEILNSFLAVHKHHGRRQTSITFHTNELSQHQANATTVIEIEAKKSRWKPYLAAIVVSVLVGFTVIFNPFVLSQPPNRLGLYVEVEGLNDADQAVARSILDYSLSAMVNNSKGFVVASASALPSDVVADMRWRSLGAEHGVIAKLVCVSERHCELTSEYRDINNDLIASSAPSAISFRAPDSIVLGNQLTTILNHPMPLDRDALTQAEFELLSVADDAIFHRRGLDGDQLDALFALSERTQSRQITRKLLEVVKDREDQSDFAQVDRFEALLNTLKTSLARYDYLSLEIAYEVYLRRNPQIEAQLAELNIIEQQRGIQEDDVLTRAARHFYLNDPQSAYNELTRAIEISPSWRLENAAIWYASNLLEDFRLVETHLESLLMFQPNNRQVRQQQLNVAIVRARIDWLMDGSEFFSDDIVQRNQALAWAAIYNDDWAKALELTEAAYNENLVSSNGRTQAQLTLLYADALLKNGRIDESRSIYRQLLARFESGDTSVSTNLIIQSVWHTESAHEAIKRFIGDDRKSISEVSVDISFYWLFRSINHTNAIVYRERCLRKGISPLLLDLEL